MPDLTPEADGFVLHHYAGSPFSQKIRWLMGWHGLNWHSVNVPAIMPKPDVVALTGGYRKTPFLQRGADIWCDSALMAKVLDGHGRADATLFPAATRGQAETLAQWADSSLFWCAIPYAMQPAGIGALLGNPPPEVLKAFAADRAAFTPDMRRPTVADAGAALRTYLARLEQMLSANPGGFLLGSQPCIADLSAAQSVWFVRRAGSPVADLLQPFALVAAWFDRVAAFGDGQASRLSSTDAIAQAHAAAQADRHVPVHVTPGQGLEACAAVQVCATDYGRDVVSGELVGLTDDEIVLAREDERAGRVHVHFPRLGFDVRAAR